MKVISLNSSRCSFLKLLDSYNLVDEDIGAPAFLKVGMGGLRSEVIRDELAFLSILLLFPFCRVPSFPIILFYKPCS